jgi:hypothetical protein
MTTPEPPPGYTRVGQYDVPNEPLNLPTTDDRNPKICPKCQNWCVYDGWGHIHGTGLGIGSCVTPTLSDAELTLARVRALADEHPDDAVPVIPLTELLAALNPGRDR